ncbi:MAG TPA: HD domain-containing protein [Saprospiraceae bacterium]|nr:HD domain-containing protein [Saprospiraceae bacterium]
MNRPARDRLDMEAYLKLETEAERRLLTDPTFYEGLNWGVPRFGHPEGEVYKHVREVLDNIGRLATTEIIRRRLRLIALAHDTFKYLEDKRFPRDWSKHHGVYARRFLEQYTDDQAILDITELHDEAYYAWRLQFLYHEPRAGEDRLQHLLDVMGDNLQIYYLFFKCDTQTGDKNQAPLKWFESTVKGIEVAALEY